jgi:hypothetical protein
VREPRDNAQVIGHLLVRAIEAAALSLLLRDFPTASNESGATEYRPKNQL